MSARAAVESAPPPVAGIVLAGGRSLRMGEPKALLKVGGASFLERAARTLAEGGCSPVLAVVLPGETGERLLELALRAGARGIVNRKPDAEQIDSLRVGLEALQPDVAAAAVLPVDHPRVRAATIGSLLSAFRASGALLVRPTHEGRPGHPVLFARLLWTELQAPDLKQGAREVVHRHHGEIEEVPVDDPGIAIDVNTPEEYAREMGAA